MKPKEQFYKSLEEEIEVACQMLENMKNINL